MIIEFIPIEKIKIAKYNPRKDLKPGDPEYKKLKIEFIASLPPIQSAIQLDGMGDDGRVKFDILGVWDYN